MAKELWVIEAPGKAKTLEGLLQRIGLDAKVQATKGHFMTMPSSLTPLGIDRQLHEFARQPRDMDLVRRLTEMAREAEKLVIATDADSEGDAIAWDVAELLADIHPNPVRVKMRGMDVDSLREALVEAGPVRKQDAIPGRTRAIVDRMVGSVFSKDGVGVGRVSSALLGLVNTTQPTLYRLTLVSPAKDRGRPWFAELDVKPPFTVEIARRLAGLALPPLDFEKAQAPAPAKPGHMGDIMVRAADRLDISPKDSSKALQRLYEAGKMTYPRAGERGMSKGAMRRLAKALKESGFKFDGEVIPEKGPEAVHDAPHPIGPVNVAMDPRRLGEEEGIRTMVARDLIRSGQKHVVEQPATYPLYRFLIGQGFGDDISKRVANLAWRRENGPSYPGQENWKESKLVERRADAVLLEAAMNAGLGRPSTWANHIDTFLSRGLVDSQMQLTSKGREWLAATPPELLDPRLSAAIEKACEKVTAAENCPAGREPWEFLAERIVSVLPEQVRAPLHNAVKDEAPRPRLDLRSLAAPGLDEAGLRAARPTPGFRPD